MQIPRQHVPKKFRYTYSWNYNCNDIGPVPVCRNVQLFYKNQIAWLLSLNSSTYRGLFLRLIPLIDQKTLGRTSLDEISARRRDLYLTTHNFHKRHPWPRRDSNPQSQQASGGRSPVRPLGSAWTVCMKQVALGSTAVTLLVWGTQPDVFLRSCTGARHCTVPA
jgi:hypothetical protein